MRQTENPDLVEDDSGERYDDEHFVKQVRRRHSYRDSLTFRHNYIPRTFLSSLHNPCVNTLHRCW
jgi:hypothetical protein